MILTKEFVDDMHKLAMQLMDENPIILKKD